MIQRWESGKGETMLEFLTTWEESPGHKAGVLVPTTNPAPKMAHLGRSTLLAPLC